MATAKLSATFQFGAYGTNTESFAIETYETDAAAVSSFKQNIINFNSADDSDTVAVKANLIDDDGDSCTGIKDAYIEFTEITSLQVK